MGSTTEEEPETEQQAEPLQHFGSQEHQSLGDSATGSASYELGSGEAPFQLTHGDLIALSGDYFLAGPDATSSGAMSSGAMSSGGRGPEDDVFYLAGRPGDLGQAPSTRDEIVWALKLIRRADARFAPGGAWTQYVFSDAVKAAVNERYQRLAAANTSHFAAPRGRDASGAPNPSPEGSAGASYRSAHEAALRLAFALGQRHQPIDRAMALEAAGQHYLTDAFSAGHLRTPIGDLREYWSSVYPLFWYNLRRKMALDTAVRLNDISTNLSTLLGTVNQMYEEISEQIEAMATSLPAVTLGDLLSKIFHDADNDSGLEIAGGGGARVYGDGQLDNPDPRNQTRPLAEAAIRDGNGDIRLAHQLGQDAGDGAPLPDGELFAQVRARSGSGDRYLAETRTPVPSSAEPQQNWRAASLEELWELNVTGSAGPTIGAKIIEALQPGHEIRDTLEDLANRFPETDGRWSGDLYPRRAYREGFLAPLLANPRQGLLHLAHWAPNYGLASSSRDDQARNSGRELDGRGELGGMTTPARAAYIRELIGGSCAESEGKLVVRIFETAPASERRGLYQQIEGHAWTGDFRRGLWVADDKLWNALTTAQLGALRTLLNQ